MLLNHPYSFFFWLGMINLVYLTWQDYRDHMEIDDRKNYLMLGLSISLFYMLQRSGWLFIGLIIFSMIVFWSFKKLSFFGEGDLSALNWIFIGLGLIDLFYLFLFVIVFFVLTYIYSGIKLYVFKVKQPTPFFAVILISFWFTGFLVHGF